MTSLPPVHLSAPDKLRVLRRLDRFRTWESLDDKRQCIQCGEIISGRDIEVVGGTRQLGPLRLQCPTENCPAIPMDWIIPTGSVVSTSKPARAASSSTAVAKKRALVATLLRALTLRRHR